MIDVSRRCQLTMELEVLLQEKFTDAEIMTLSRWLNIVEQEKN